MTNAVTGIRLDFDTQKRLEILRKLMNAKAGLQMNKTDILRFIILKGLVDTENDLLA